MHMQTTLLFPRTTVSDWTEFGREEKPDFQVINAKISPITRNVKACTSGINNGFSQ
jgi:hypothetical protein